MNLVEAMNKLKNISFDLFQDQDEVMIIDKDGNEITEIKLVNNKIVIK